MLNAADWGRKNELDISTMKKCEEFIENEGLLNDELLEDFYKEMYNDLIDERVVGNIPVTKETEKLDEDGIRRIYLKLKAKGHSIETIQKVIDGVNQERRDKKKKNLKQHKVNFNPYLWSYK